MKKWRLIIFLLVCLFISIIYIEFFYYNQHNEWGHPISYESKNIVVDTLNSKKIKIILVKDEFHIRNRVLLICNGSNNIYYGDSILQKPVYGFIKQQDLDKDADINVTIINPHSNSGYYFESKEPLFMDRQTSVIKISLLKNKEYSDRIKVTGE